MVGGSGLGEGKKGKSPPTYPVIPLPGVNPAERCEHTRSKRYGSPWKHPQGASAGEWVLRGDTLIQWSCKQRE